jgi:rare lipoprotein A
MIRFAFMLCVAVPVFTSISDAKSSDASAERELGSGQASYYAREFAGRRTASGEAFNPSAMTCAHRTARFGSRIRVTNTSNGKQVIVRVNDRGPHIKNRIIDLSYAAAQKIGMVSSGTARVRLTLVD